MGFIYVADGIDDVLAAHLNQYADAWTGVAGKGQPFNAVAVNDPINFAISARNLDPTNSRACQFLKADGTVLFQVDASGVKVSPDGTVASVPVTATATQTLTNKTLVVPVGAPTADGALGEAAGGLLSVGNGTAAIPMGAYKIAETVLGAAAVSFDFTGIPATFRHLLLEVTGRGDAAVVTGASLLRFNNDATGVYHRQYLTAGGATAPVTGETAGATSAYIGEFPGSSAVAGYSGYSVIFIPHYAGTTFNKHMKFQGGVANPNGAGTSQYQTGQAIWASTAAVTRITVLPGAAGTNFIAGTIATLYGLS